MTDTVPTVIPDRPSLADKIKSVDAVSVAARIIACGPRGAMQVSTIEIIALAKHLLTLKNLADLTYDMLATSDRIGPQIAPAERELLKRELDRKIDLVGVSLEALGYLPETPPSPQQKDNSDG